MSWFGLGFHEDFYGGGGYSSGYGPDRRDWADKSQAAIRRETQAKGLFDGFLKTVDQEITSASFPYSKEVIPPQVHLTSACYTSFRKYVLAKGCKCVRREASHDEKMNLTKSDRRNCKMYFIKITVPTSPSQLLQAKAEQEKKAQEQKAKKQAAEEKKRKLERELFQKTKQEHALAVAHVTGGNSKGDTGTDGTSTTATSTAVDDKENIANQQQPEQEEGSPSKKLKTCSDDAAALVITVPQARILQFHQSQLTNAKYKKRQEVSRQKQEELAKMEQEIAAKYKTLEQEALNKTQAQFDLIKTAILEAVAITKKPTTSSTTATTAAADAKPTTSTTGVAVATK